MIALINLAVYVVLTGVLVFVIWAMNNPDLGAM